MHNLYYSQQSEKQVVSANPLLEGTISQKTREVHGMLKQSEALLFFLAL